MKGFKQHLLAAILITVAGTQLTNAATSTAQASIDWSSLSIQLIDLSGGLNTPTLNWTFQNGDANSYAYTNYPQEYHYISSPTADNFSTPLTASTAAGQVQSASVRNASLLQASVTAQDPLNPEAYLDNYGNASARNNGSFELSGKGIALFSLSWTAALTNVYPNYHYWWNNYAEVRIDGYFSDNNSTFGSVNSGTVLHSYYAQNGDISQNGSFVMAVYSDGIHTATGSIDARASAQLYSASAVPLPTAVWLFGSALMAWLGFARRQSAMA